MKDAGIREEEESMKLSWPVRIEKMEEGHESFLAQGLPPQTGVITEGDTLEEAVRNAREALTCVLGSMLDHGLDIPDPARSIGSEEGIYWIEPDPKVASRSW